MTLLIESGTQGLLVVNGQFMGPMEPEGQAFPMGKNAEVYIQLFPFGAAAAPLAARLLLKNGQIETLEPKDCCYALLWPDGIIQLELRPREEERLREETAASGVLLRYCAMRLAGDPQAAQLWLRAQDERHAPDLSAYHAVVPLRFAPVSAGERYDDRAGLVRRVMQNAARVDAALAVTTPAGSGRRLIERMDILRTDDAGKHHSI